MKCWRKIFLGSCFLLLLPLIGCGDSRLLYRVDNGARAGNRFGVTNEGGGVRMYGSFGHAISWQHGGR